MSNKLAAKSERFKIGREVEFLVYLKNLFVVLIMAGAKFSGGFIIKVTHSGMGRCVWLYIFKIWFGARGNSWRVELSIFDILK